MKNKKNKMTIIALLLVVALSFQVAAMAHSVDDLPRRAENSTEFVPLRQAAYEQGATVQWDGANRLVTITGASGSFTITVPVEAAGGFIEEGTSWMPLEYVIGLFDVSASEEPADEPVDDEAAALAAFIVALVDAIEETESLVSERSEILTTTSTDGYVFQSRLTVPDGDEPVPAIVIDTGTSGPNTYLMRRYIPGIGQWNYWDFWANELANNNIAFLTSNTRGVTPSDEPPEFQNIDADGYLTYLPLNVVEDIYHMIRTVRENPRLRDAEIYLIGFSEGAVIATLFEYTHPGLVDALFLGGVPITNMYEVIQWQASGGGTMMLLGLGFETDEYGRISREAFYAGPWEVEFAGIAESFEDIDFDADGYFAISDLLTLWETLGVPPHLYDADVVFRAIADSDDAWLRENYPILLTSGWFQEHFALMSNMELIPKLDLPIYIFHGTLDLNVHVRYVEELGEKLSELGRTNVTINIFPEHNHDLNWSIAVFLGEVSEGIEAILAAIYARVG